MKHTIKASTAPTPADCGGSPGELQHTQDQSQSLSDPETMHHDASETGSEVYDSPEALAQTAQATRPKIRRVFACIRIVDFCLKALCPTDAEDPHGEQDWSDISGATTLSTDREAMFQLARQNDGLLMSTTGLPGGKAMMALQERARYLSGALPRGVTESNKPF